MDFKHRLRKLRSEAGLSQESLGEALHISKDKIAKYESGSEKPSEDTLKALAAYFCVSESELKGEDESTIAAKAAKKKQVIKWLLISIGIAVGVFGLFIILALLTLPYHSFNR